MGGEVLQLLLNKGLQSLMHDLDWDHSCIVLFMIYTKRITSHTFTARSDYHFRD